MEELNLEAMGLINDAKCMLDSLMVWEKGLTSHGRLYRFRHAYSFSVRVRNSCATLDVSRWTEDDT
ncbi:MAG: hypothetical protein PVH34_02995 [Syntrophobacterales bacterium]